MSDDRRFTISSSARLSPDDVQRRTFSTVRRGFDTNEVRAFLEVAARELAALTERETELRQALADAEHRAANPVIDEETLTAALGQETARVLRAARDAAGEVLSRGEQDAARLRAEAQEQADELRSRAERHAAEQSAQADADAAEARRRAHEDADTMRTNAKLEADSLLADTRTECRAMVHEAQELRTRVLNDLSKRRRVLHSQIEQLRAGRERMAETIASVRQVVDEVADALLHAEDDARLAAEEASRHLPAIDDELPMPAMDESVLFADDALARPATGNPMVSGGGSDGRGDVEAAVAGGGSPADPERPGLAEPVVEEVSRGLGRQVVDPVDPAIAEPSDHGRLSSLTSADAEVGSGAAEPGIDLDGASSGASSGDAVIVGGDAGDAGDAVEAAGVEVASGGAAGEAVSIGEPVRSPLSIAMPAGEAVAREPQAGAHPAAAAGSDVDELFARLRASRQAAAGTAPDAVPEATGTADAGARAGSASTPDRPRRRGAPDPAFDRRADEPYSVAEEPAVPGGAAGAYDDDGPAVRLLQAGAKPRARRRPTATQSAETGAVTATSDPMPVVGDQQRSGGSRQGGSPTRAGGTRTVPVQSGAPAAAADAEPVEAAAIAERAAIADLVTPTTVAPGDPAQQSEDAEDDLGPASTPEAGDGPLLARRDDAVRPVIANLARRLKRALQDDQNDLLDRLRSAPGKVGSPSEPVGLPDEEEHRKRYVEVARSHLAEAARIGAAFVGATAGARDFDAQGAAEAAELAAALVVPLRRKLGHEADGGGDGDGSHRADQVGAAFREWKGSRVEALAADHVVAAFAAAALAAVPAAQKMRWVVDDDGGACADCDDNALAGGVVAGDEFPTGHRHPPVHAGCRCLLAPVSP